MRKLAAIAGELNDLDYQPRPVMTVRDFVEDKYLKLALPVRKPTTQHGYEVVLRRHVLPEFGHRQLADVTREQIQAFINLKSNPARSSDLPPEPVQVLVPLPSDEEIQRLLDALQEPYRTMEWLVCVTGVRSCWPTRTLSGLRSFGRGRPMRRRMTGRPRKLAGAGRSVPTRHWKRSRLGPRKSASPS